MPIEFYTHAGTEVSKMSNNRARAFAGITNGIAEAFGRPRPVVYDNEEDYFVINEEKFCALVEFVFDTRPLDVMLSWAEYAAGIYESIKGCLYEWHWDAGFPENIPNPSPSTRPAFIAVNFSKYKPTEHSGKKIGRTGYK